MTFPADWAKITVTGTFLDETGAPLSGYVLFDGAPAVIVDGKMVRPGIFKASLDGAGSISIQLPATDDPDITPRGWSYRVREVIGSRSRDPFYIDVPYDGGALDLSTVVPVTPNQLELLSQHFALLSDLASLGVSKGGALVDGTREATGFPAISTRSKTNDTLGLVEFLDTEADRDAVRNYAMATDLTEHVQAAIYYAVKNGLRLMLPAGNIPFSSLIIDRSDVLLTSRNHIHIIGQGACDPRDNADYRGTVLQQIAETNAPALLIQGDGSVVPALFFKSVQVRGFTIIGAAANTGWLVDTRCVSGFLSTFEDLNLRLQNKAGSGLRANSNWTVDYRGIRVDGAGTGDGSATGTAMAVYGSTAQGTTNMTRILGCQFSKCGTGLSLASAAGTTKNLIVEGGQVDTCDVAGVAIGFLQNSQIRSVHVEQCYHEGWLIGDPALGDPRQLELVGCSSFKNAMHDTRYDMNIIRGINIEVRGHDFDETDRGVSITSGADTDNIAINSCRFDPFNAAGGGHATVAINNPGANTSTRVHEDGKNYFAAAYDSYYAAAAQMIRPRPQYGYFANLDADTAAFTIKLHNFQTRVRFAGYGFAVTLTTVVNQDGTALQDGQRFVVSSSNGNISIGGGVSFAIPCAVFTLLQNREYEFICEGGVFRFMQVPAIPVSAAELGAKTNAVNTVDKSAGVQRFNTTSGLPMWARGAVNTSDWVDSAGTVITPA